jgi:ubiquitin C-terminal hydrolase
LPVSYKEQVSFEEKSDGVLVNFLAADVSLQIGVTSYGICTVVNHIGSLASCGHYTANAKQMYNSTIKEWMRFNDSNVSKITSADAVKNSSRMAYTILYEIEPY